jgi:hypothetical protein
VRTWLLVVSLVAAAAITGCTDDTDAPPADDLGVTTGDEGDGTTAPPPDKPKGPDGRDRLLADFVNLAGESVLAAVLGRPHNARFDLPRQGPDLRTIPAPYVERVKSRVGDQLQLKVTLVYLELASDKGLVASIVAVFPDGRVKWSKLGVEGVGQEPTQGLAAAAPDLNGAAERMLDALETADPLPLATPDDLSGFPDPLVELALADQAAFATAREAFKSLGSANWRPRVNKIIVFGQSQQGWARFDIEWGVHGTGFAILRPGGVELAPPRFFR